MSHDTNNGKDSQSMTWGSADGDGDGDITRERPRARPLTRLAHRCSSLVDGLLLASSEGDVDGELVDPATTNIGRAKWTALLTNKTGRYRIHRVRWEKSGVETNEGPSEQREEKPVDRQKK